MSLEIQNACLIVLFVCLLFRPCFVFIFIYFRSFVFFGFVCLFFVGGGGDRGPVVQSPGLT